MTPYAEALAGRAQAQAELVKLDGTPMDLHDYMTAVRSLRRRIRETTRVIEDFERRTQPEDLA